MTSMCWASTATCNGLDLSLSLELTLAPSDISDFIRLTTDENNYVQWDMSIGGIAGVGTTVDFDFGIPGLGIEAEGGIGLAFDWDLDFGFGLSLDEGFYLNVEDDNVSGSSGGGGSFGQLFLPLMMFLSIVRLLRSRKTGCRQAMRCWCWVGRRC